MRFIDAIESLVQRLKQSMSLYEKISLLDEEAPVAKFLQTTHPLRSFLAGLSPECEVAFKQLIAIGQAPLHCDVISVEDIRDLLGHLIEVDDFYRELGGIAGYQLQVRRLLQKREDGYADTQYLSPSFIDISEETEEVRRAIDAGIDAMPYQCEMYPLGGAADRLHLVDDKTGNELPAAKLEFAGQTLLERLLRDLESREYIYFKKTGTVLTTPVAIMTSPEKDNKIHIEEILEKNAWFGRPKESFRLFVQPMVPAVDQEGKWRWSSPWRLLLKPGGHGAIWKLAKDQGVFDWMRTLGVKYTLVRQINNPLAGLDYGLLAFTGIGFLRNMSFGFASCPRVCGAAEGVNVMVERKTSEGYSYVLSNIEYCDFSKYSIEDRPLRQGSPYSRFTSNTNILFADLAALEMAVEKCPFPGLLMNLKKDAAGIETGRLESTMQNIADVFVEEREQPLKESGLTRTFVTYNHRHKTISTVKKAFLPGLSLNETPENCFNDLMRAYSDLLKGFCSFELPEERSLEETLVSHPSFVFLFHQALGPLFREIGRKIRGGKLGDGSELRLEIADVDLEQLDLVGSCKILANNPLGSFRFSSALPKCSMHNVKIVNRGVDWEQSKPFWRGCYHYRESLVIVLKGRSEFFAENVCFSGCQKFEVRDGEKMIVSQEGGSLSVRRQWL